MIYVYTHVYILYNSILYGVYIYIYIIIHHSNSMGSVIISLAD